MLVKHGSARPTSTEAAWQENLIKEIMGYKTLVPDMIWGELRATKRGRKEEDHEAWIKKEKKKDRILLASF